jgi:hypothetical protein
VSAVLPDRATTTVAEIAEIIGVLGVLGVHRDAVYDTVHRGDIPSADGVAALPRGLVSPVRRGHRKTAPAAAATATRMHARMVRALLSTMCWAIRATSPPR